MIDEKKLILHLNDWMLQESYLRQLKNPADIISECIKAVEEQPKISEWIPCSERLPEEGQRVLATHEAGLDPNRKVIEHYFHDGKFLNNWDMDTDFKSPTFGQHYMGDVIAWQPLPEKYHEQVD